MRERLEAYEGLVHAWAPRIDLVAPGDLERFWERHIEDSLRLVALLDEVPPGPCADVGSGAGLPGIPLAIARPERPWRLLEPRRKRAGFLEEIVRELDLSCEVLTLTAQQAAEHPDLRAAHALVTARALAVPSEVLELLVPLVADGGAAAFYVGEASDMPERAERWGSGIAIVRKEST